MQEWIADELATLDLGDVRLDQRCHAVLDRLSAGFSVSIPAACVGLAEIAATYRFFDNDRVDDSELLHPHRDATVARIRQERVVLTLQTPPNSTTLAPKKWSPALVRSPPKLGSAFTIMFTSPLPPAALPGGGRCRHLGTRPGRLRQATRQGE